MISPVLVAALVRALTTGCVVVLASTLAEAAGPFWGALILSLPVSAGPAYVFMALEHDGAFIAGAALNGFAANAATGLFLIVYAWRAPATGSLRALGTAAAAWLAAAVPIAAWAWTPPTAFLLNAAVFGAGLVLVRPKGRTVFARNTVATRRWLDLSARAAAVALFVTALVALSTALGPERTGVVAAYPVSLTCAFVILHARVGGAAMAQLAATAIRGIFGFGLTLLTLHLLVEAWGAALALSGALLVSLLWSGGLLALQRRAARPGPRPPG
ncbi:hypothetical protein Q8W71_15250 [Methylobacterium sp. NEAU 140]|uniref:hypothetical protein n=1 Tax=Methylobacterium sp. NEAU 140 TaxID=3064945 RepID=UPI002733D41D|nr:hypothetical protein [Methylobacterium sp. NEAU 140]MDP4023986.1 hypothetical protein [Methylobacterium sp. NEAU 140]